MLEIGDLTVSFGGVRPLDGVSLSFDDGVCGLVGPNGAGKTTLFNVLSGFVAAAGGSARSNGLDLLREPPYRRARWGLRRTFQQEQVIRDLSALDNVRLAADHLGGGEQEALDFVGLERRERRGYELSMLERRLVELARAVIGEPRVVLLDEPGAGLAEEESSRLIALIGEIPRRFGALVVLVDHDMDLISAVCSRTAVLDFGKLIALDDTAAVLRDERVKRAFLGTADVT